MADSGERGNVLDEKDYRALTYPLLLRQTKVKIHPYKSSESLTVLGKFTTKVHVKQLKRDMELGVIERIEGPTPWVFPIVVAPKPKFPGQTRV